MNRVISEIMTPSVISVNSEHSIADVKVVLDSLKLRIVPVLNDDGRCFGVISASDLVRFYRSNQNENAVRAWEICTHNIVGADPEDTIIEAAYRMLDNEIHHVVVMKNESPVGMVSTLDVIRYLLGEDSQLKDIECRTVYEKSN